MVLEKRGGGEVDLAVGGRSKRRVDVYVASDVPVNDMSRESVTSQFLVMS